MADETRPPKPEIPPEMQAGVDLSAYDWEELDPPDWLTNLDREILAILGNTLVIMTPAIIAKNIDRSRSSVSRRLSTLEAGEMVEKVERGHYKISDKGYAMMFQKVPTKAPSGRDEDEEWVSYGILTPDELEELKEEGKVDRFSTDS